MNRLRNLLFRLTHPSFWFPLHPECREWDEMLNHLLDTEKITEIRRYTCQIGPAEVWIENYPYAFGHPVNPDVLISAFPLTKERLRKKITETAFKKMIRTKFKVIQGGT